MKNGKHHVPDLKRPVRLAEQLMRLEYCWPFPIPIVLASAMDCSWPLYPIWPPSPKVTWGSISLAEVLRKKVRSLKRKVAFEAKKYLLRYHLRAFAHRLFAWFEPVEICDVVWPRRPRPRLPSHHYCHHYWRPFRLPQYWQRNHWYYACHYSLMLLWPLLWLSMRFHGGCYYYFPWHL